MTQASNKSHLTVPSVPERRATPRRRTLFSGKIIFNQHSSVLSCVVRNLSKSGACLEVDSQLGIPDQFELLVEGAGIRAEYRVIWRRAKRIGISRLNVSSDRQDGGT
ncbi:PilZ domain-containing protein [Rhodoligotrophos defluvii]|uniref:PilZ domain-containing protein n=1 Tax=Rhodoligotrophos defluvii TaxID=2561934 RepID=UPI0010C9BE45|nr:PilZ domain-containing protein [Rhodoligotrophos defluvii]